MKPIYTFVANKTVMPNTAVNMASVLQKNVTCGIGGTSVNERYYETQYLNHNQEASNCLWLKQSKKNYLSVDTAKKMISRLLGEKSLTRNKLAKNLAITRKELRLLLDDEEIMWRLLPKINLSLIKLYCATKFNDLKTNGSLQRMVNNKAFNFCSTSRD